MHWKPITQVFQRGGGSFLPARPGSPQDSHPHHYHGHAALMGVFGMEAVALMVLGFRQVLSDEQWVRPEKYVRVLNIGLLLMVVGNLFPGGVMQLYDVLNNGYWHARGADYLDQDFVRFIEWCRLPGDAIFIVLGVIPLVIAAVLTYWSLRRSPVKAG